MAVQKLEHVQEVVEPHVHDHTYLHIYIYIYMYIYTYIQVYAYGVVHEYVKVLLDPEMRLRSIVMTNVANVWCLAKLKIRSWPKRLPPPCRGHGCPEVACPASPIIPGVF